MEKTVTNNGVNKNIDMELFGQLKAINFEYLVQLSNIIEEFSYSVGADTLDEEMVKFDMTLGKVIKERMSELIHAEEKVKELIKEDREEKSTIKYIKEAKEYLQSLGDTMDGKTVDCECLDIIERLKGTIYEFGTLETSIDVLKTLLTTDIYKDNETVQRAILANYLACWEVIREVEQEELDETREYINSIEIGEDEEEIKDLIDGYNLNADWNFCGWYMSNKFGLAHIDEIYLTEYIENDKMYFVFQDANDFDLCESYCLE